MPHPSRIGPRPDAARRRALGTLAFAAATAIACACPAPGIAPCRADADCAVQPDQVAWCNAGRCETTFTGGPLCMPDGGCPRGSACGRSDAGYEVCFALRSCINTAACPGGFACRDGYCRTIACVTDLECAFGERCKNDACDFIGCRVDADCDPGFRCVPETNTCVECREDADCAAARPICRSDQQCVMCRSDADCGDGKPPFCFLNTGMCVHCMKNDDCAPGLLCSGLKVCRGVPEGGACATFPLSTITCTTNSQCAAAEPNFPTCIDDVCGRYLTCDIGGICVRLTSGGTSQLTCLNQCNPYAPDCAPGKGCALLSTGPDTIAFDFGRPLGACLDQPPNGARLGDGCGAGVYCLFGLECIPISVDSRLCRRYCDPVNPEPTCPAASGNTCNRVFVGDSAGEDLGVCYPPSNLYKICTDNAACGSAFGCQIGKVPWGPPLDPEYDSYANRCGYPPGSGGALDPCAKHGDCKSGICIQRASKPMYCYGACDEDADCPAGICEKHQFTIPVGGTPLDVQVPGCRGRACVSSGECASASPALPVCGVEPSPSNPDGALVRRCQIALGSGGAGAPCASGADCKTGICFRAAADGGPADICWESCSPVAVPGDCPSGMRCQAAALTLTAANGTSQQYFPGCVF